MANIGELNVRLGADIKNLRKGLARSQFLLRKSARSFENLGNKMSSAITLPFIGASIAGIKFAADIETSFAKIENLVGVTGKLLEGFKEDVKKLSGEVGKSQKELADALFVVTSAGIRGKQSLEILTQAAKASTIGLGQTADVARAVTSVMTAYKDTNISAATATDILTAVIREGNLEAESLAPVLGNVLGISARLGVSFEEVGANIATFTRLGVSAENAVTGLTSLMSGILSPSEKAKKALAGVGLSFNVLRKSIKEQGLAATLNLLVKRFEGNDEALGKVIPNIRALKNVLGTAGVQGKEYAKIVDSISKSTGIVDKGFEKASQTVKVKFNKELVKLQNRSVELGVTFLPIVEKILNSINSLSKSFAGLSDSTKKTIIIVGLFVSAIGPALKIVGIYKFALADLKGMIVGLKVAVTKLKFRLAEMNAVAKANLVGILVTAVAAAIIVFKAWNSQLSQAQKIQKNLKDVQASAEAATAAERKEVDFLVDKLKDENTARVDKVKALKKLKEINPGYFGQLEIEKGKVDGLNIAYQNFVENLLRTAKAKAASDKIDELAKKQAELNRELEDFQKKNGLEQFAINAADALFNSKLTPRIAQLVLEIANLDEQMKNLAQISFDNLPSGGGGNAKTKGSSRIAGRGLGGFQRSAENISKLPLNSFLTEIQSTSVGVNEQLQAMSANLLQSALAVQPLTDEFSLLKNQLNLVSEAFTGFGEVIAATLGNVIDSALAGASSFRELGKAALAAAADQIRAAMAIAIANIISKIFSKHPILGAILAPIAVATFTGIFNKFVGGVKAPQLAQGGLAFGPTLATVGDNPGASRDPEVIAPLSKINSLLGDRRPGKLEVFGTLRASGKELVVVIEGAQRDLLRSRGF